MSDQEHGTEPPRLARVLLERLLRSADAEFILGDLHEGFIRMSRERGTLRARVWFWRQALTCVASAGGRRGRRHAGTDLSFQGSLHLLARDLRLAFRSLLRRPLFAGTAVLTIALGVGPSLSVLALVESTLLRPPPFTEPERLVFVWSRLGRAPGERARLSLPDVTDLRQRTRLFDGFAATDNLREAALESEGRSDAIHFGRATPNFFELLGVEAALGRVFAEGDAPPAGSDGSTPTVLVLSDALWRRAFGADPSVIGRSVRVDGQSFVVAGVLAADFHLRLPPDVGLPDGADAWAPLPASALDRSLARDLLSRDQDSDNTGVVLARLSPGTALEAARDEVAGVASALREELPVYRNAGVRMEVEPALVDSVRHVRPVLLALLAASLLVLLVAAVNVAQLMIVRASARSGEMAVHVALGASRARMLIHGIAESIVLASLGAAAGLLAAPPLTRLLLAFAPSGLRVVTPASPDARLIALVLAITVGVTLGIATLVLRLAPSASPAADLRVGARSSHGTQTRARHRLVTAEVALAGVLVLGAVLLLRSAARLGQVDPGFRSEGALIFRLSLRDPARYRGPADRSAFIVTLEERLAEIRGVEAVGGGTVLPLSGRTWTNGYGDPDDPPELWLSNEADYRMITPGYLGALGVPLLAGRHFTRAEMARETSRVVIVDETLAKELAGPGERLGEVVGRRLGFPIEGRPVDAEIVGVVGSVRHESLSEPGRRTLYVPYRHEASRSVTVVLRGRGDPASLAPAVRQAVADTDPQLPIQELRTLASYLEEAAAPLRFALYLLATYATAAVALSALGLYGIVGYAVSQRRRELGVRMALGAEKGALVRSVVGEGIRRTGIGLAIAGALAVPFALLLRQLLYGITPFDAVAWTVSATVLAIVALVACYLPARSISRLDPTEALRSE